MKLYDHILNEYGAVVLAAILKENEAQENYEECQIIEDVLKRKEAAGNFNFPREINEATFDMYKDALVTLGHDGDDALENFEDGLRKAKQYIYNYKKSQ